MSVTYQRGLFFAAVRKTFGALKEGQVTGFEAILVEAEKRAPEVRFIAYMLATAWWETAHTMAAIREYGLGKGHDYGQPDPVTGKTYYGRGLVQLTHKTNYAKMTPFARVDLVADPDRALDLPIAVTIMFEGMLRGSFTGKKLADYFRGDVSDWTGARRIINGTDHASDIAEIGRSFLGILTGCASVGAAPVSAALAAAAKPAPAPAAAASAPVKAAAKAPTMTSTSANALAAAHPQVAAALPNVDFLQGAKDFVTGIVHDLENGAAAIASPKLPNVTDASGLGTAANLSAAAGKLKEILADVAKSDKQEAVADGVDLFKMGMATLTTFNIPYVGLVNGVARLIPSLHAGGVDKVA